MITSESARPPESLAEPILADERLSAPALELTGIERSWGSQKVLNGVSLTVQKGSVAWLGGRNGAGKTTLLRIAAGILIPQLGSVALHGFDPERNRREYHRRLGFLPAGDRGMYARLSVMQNLELAARLAQVHRGDRRRLVEQGIARFGLEPLTRQRVDRISLGQRQRVRLAMTFVHEPEVVLLDEPHTSLDDQALELLEAAMFDCALRGGSVLWCSPTSEMLPLPANLRYVIADGKVSPG
jgi:ABC-2 type transport system ATP-binding protein